MNLAPNQGIPRHIIMLMAMMAGLTIANLYYNQPLLEMIRSDLQTTSSLANLIAVITQVGYAMGLLFIIPSTTRAVSTRRVRRPSATAAGLDNRVTAVALNVPAMQDLGGTRAGRRGGWPEGYWRPLWVEEYLKPRKDIILNYLK